MPDLTQSEFDIAFAFTRPAAAPVTTAAGAVVTAPVDAPRFDYADGAALGLLVEPGATLGQADRCRIDPLMLPDQIAGEAVTVLHRFTALSGVEERRAYYSRDAEATVNVLLSLAGHHAEIGVVPGHLPNQGGLVRFRHQSWYLITLLSAGDGTLLSDDAARPLIGG